MEHTLTGVVENPGDAQHIIDKLMARCLCDRSDISLMASEQAGQATLTRAARATGQVAAAAGTAVASTLGGLLGAASAVVSRPVSSLGVLSVVGQLGAMLSRTAFTTIEEMAKAFVAFGVEGDLAREYAEALRRGGIVIVVNAKTDAMASCARQILTTQGAAAKEPAAP